MGGVSWTEHLAGWMSSNQTDFNQALLEGRRDGVRLRTKLTIQIDDLEQFTSSKQARVTGGFVEGSKLGPRLSVETGMFELFVPSSELFDLQHLRMRYRLNLIDQAGTKRTLHGFKLVEDDAVSDTWHDTTTLFVRLYDGWLHEYGGPGEAQARRMAQREQAQRLEAGEGAREEPPNALGAEPAARVLATGVIRISAASFLRQLTSFRGTRGAPWSRVADVRRFWGLFGGGLAKVYVGPPIRDGSSSFPIDRLPAPWQPKPSRQEWGPVPGRETADAAAGRCALERAVVPFDVDDLSFPLNLHHLRVAGREPSGEPVLLVPGSGVRAELYYGEPLHETMADCLLREGFDVWVENWRASIDLPNNSYTLDQVARLDHPRAVETVLAETRRSNLRAVVHCQGSISFLMAALAGYLPEDSVSHIVSSAISLFFEIPSKTWFKQRTMLPVARRIGRGCDAQWGIRAPAPAGKLFALLSRVSERPCKNPSCQLANYMYGSGWDVLLRHENLDDAVHAWSARELGYTPFSLIQQVAESCRNGHIVPSERTNQPTVPSYVEDRPKIEGTRFAFIGGTHNFMFKPRGQQRSAEFLKQFGLTADFAPLEGYGHLDTFWGKDAAREVFPLILEALQATGQTALTGGAWWAPIGPEEPSQPSALRRRPRLSFSVPPPRKPEPPPPPEPGPEAAPPGATPEAATPGAAKSPP